MTPKPFRALRYDPSRVELASVIGRGGTDPRHVRCLIEDDAQAGDGKHASARRARLRLSELRRAGVLRLEEQPALYLIKRRGEDNSEAIGIFCAVPVEEAEPRVDESHAHMLSRGVCVAPVMLSFTDGTGRVRRTLDTASDREADAAWKEGACGYELFVIDEESTTARVVTLIGAGTIAVERGGELLAAHAAWWRAQGRTVDDASVAAAHALAFLQPAGQLWDAAPIGAAILPLGGAL